MTYRQFNMKVGMQKNRQTDGSGWWEDGVSRWTDLALVGVVDFSFLTESSVWPNFWNIELLLSPATSSEKTVETDCISNERCYMGKIMNLCFYYYNVRFYQSYLHYQYIVPYTTLYRSGEFYRQQNSWLLSLRDLPTVLDLGRGLTISPENESFKLNATRLVGEGGTTPSYDQS